MTLKMRVHAFCFACVLIFLFKYIPLIKACMHLLTVSIYAFNIFTLPLENSFVFALLKEHS
jgi:hypothetical protein